MITTAGRSCFFVANLTLRTKAHEQLAAIHTDIAESNTKAASYGTPAVSSNLPKPWGGGEVAKIAHSQVQEVQDPSQVQQFCFSTVTHQMLVAWPIMPNKHHGSSPLDGVVVSVLAKSARGKSSSVGWHHVPKTNSNTMWHINISRTVESGGRETPGLDNK